MSAIAQVLKVRNGSLESSLWHEWLSMAAVLTKHFDEVSQEDPFAFNETASVSILVAASVKAGMLAISDYSAKKRSKIDGRVRSKGRVDLWLWSQKRTWAIEFKQWMPEKRVPSFSELLKLLQSARRDANLVAKDEAKFRYGALLIPTYWIDADHADALRERLLEFVTESDAAWIIDPDTKHAGQTYIYFKRC